MSILVNKDTRLVVQGITGREGEFHTRQMIDYGTNVVAGTSPGKGGVGPRVCQSLTRCVRRSKPLAPTPLSSMSRPALPPTAVLEAADAASSWWCASPRAFRCWT